MEYQSKILNVTTTTEYGNLFTKTKVCRFFEGKITSPFEYSTNFRQKIVDFLDLTMLKDRIYLNIIIGLALAFYADNAFFTLLPLYLFELEFSPV